MILKSFLLLFFALIVAEANVKVAKLSANGRHLELEVQLPFSNEKAKLKLQKSTKFQNFPITVSENKRSYTFGSHLLNDERFSRYKSLEHAAVVSAVNISSEMAFNGHFTHKGNNYRIESLGNGKHDITKRMNPPPLPPTTKGKIESMVRRRMRRQSNQSPTTYVIELYLLLDHTVLQHFVDLAPTSGTDAMSLLNQYYTHLLDGIDTAFRAVTTISISVECIGVKIADTPAAAGWIDPTNLNGADILTKIQEYYVANGINADHVMAFTRMDIFGLSAGGTQNPSVCGMAPVGAVCGEQKVSINEDNGLHSWTTAAHELAHNMNSYHDGSSNACPSANQNLMSPGLGVLTTATVQNSVCFSSCSQSYMQQFTEGLTSAGTNCLTDNIGPRDTRFTDGTPIGQVFTLDRVCQQTYGASSTFFRTSDQVTNPSLICASIYCSSPSGGGVTSGGMRAPVGTPCDSQKRCNWKGECVSDSTAPVTTPGCFWGDTDTPASCNQWKSVLDSYPPYCPDYKTYAKSICCKTCASVCNA